MNKSLLKDERAQATFEYLPMIILVILIVVIVGALMLAIKTDLGEEIAKLIFAQ